MKTKFRGATTIRAQHLLDAAKRCGFKFIYYPNGDIIELISTNERVPKCSRLIKKEGQLYFATRRPKWYTGD